MNDNYGVASCEAVSKGYVERVNHLSLSGGDVNRTDEKGKTPLTLAVFHGNEEIVKSLVQAGVDVKQNEP